MKQLNRKVRLIPFVTTSIVVDLALFFVLLPVWFFTGLTQFLGPFLAFALFAKWIIRSRKGQHKTALPQPLSWLVFGFLLAVLVSSLFIQESYWIPMFIRNYIVTISAYLILFVTYNSIKDRSDIQRIFWAWGALAVTASLVGILVAGGLIPYRNIMTAPIAAILPEQVGQSEYYSSIVSISLGDRIHLFGALVRRISSVFPYQNIFAAALIMIIPFQFFLYKHSAGWRRVLIGLSIPLLSVNLLLTYSRGALLAIVVSFPLFLYLGRKSLNRRTQFRIVMSGMALLVLGMCLFVLFGSSLIKKINPESANIRKFIVVKSIESWKESPLFGWGTQRNIDVAGGWEDRPFKIIPALGSHSQFLSLLYRYGLVGLALFLLIYAAVFRELTRAAKDPPRDVFWRDLIRFCGWAFAANLIHSVFIDMDFDVVVLFMIWMNWALILKVRTMSKQERETSP